MKPRIRTLLAVAALVVGASLQKAIELRPGLYDAEQEVERLRAMTTTAPR
jgi:hypothetical protein